MTASAACRCGCTDVRGAPAHAVVAALAEADLDRALDAGLFTCAPCGACAPECRQTLFAAREQRQRALAARERFRAREARLARCRHERVERRATTTAAADPCGTVTALPAAAAAALARAKARAAGRTGG
ncbi:MAG: hypothetical protein ABIO58_00175 [Luteimonas sp.]